MNAQEALNEIVKLFDQMDLPEDYTRFIELKNGFASLQQLVKQSDAKPKTLEELGWLAIKPTRYRKLNREVWFRVEIKGVETFSYGYDSDQPVAMSYEEILAIAEKMKELGMTSEQIAKGETK